MFKEVLNFKNWSAKEQWTFVIVVFLALTHAITLIATGITNLF